MVLHQTTDITQCVLLGCHSRDPPSSRALSLPDQLCKGPLGGQATDLQASQQGPGVYYLDACWCTPKHLQKPLPLDTPTTIELRPGCEIQVTLFDANHCPGAAMFCETTLADDFLLCPAHRV